MCEPGRVLQRSKDKLEPSLGDLYILLHATKHCTLKGKRSSNFEQQESGRLYGVVSLTRRWINEFYSWIQFCGSFHNLHALISNSLKTTTLDLLTSKFSIKYKY